LLVFSDGTTVIHMSRVRTFSLGNVNKSVAQYFENKEP